MKIEQIRYVLEIYKTGSISKAAQKFYMSRPNMSNSVRNLENEVGFEILERSVDGVKFTKKGQAFIRHCMNIIKEVDEIQELAEEKARLQFGVVNPNCPPAEEAFIKLCRAMEAKEELSRYQLSMYREYQYESMVLLNRRKADIAITVSKDLSAPSLLREMSERGLEYKKLWDAPCNVNLSVNHPLADDPDFRLQKLRNYPLRGVRYRVRPWFALQPDFQRELCEPCKSSPGGFREHADARHCRHQCIRRRDRTAAGLGEGQRNPLHPDSGIYHGGGSNPPRRRAGIGTRTAVYGVFQRGNAVFGGIKTMGRGRL